MGPCGLRRVFLQKLMKFLGRYHVSESHRVTVWLAGGISRVDPSGESSMSGCSNMGIRQILLCRTFLLPKSMAPGACFCEEPRL